MNLGGRRNGIARVDVTNGRVRIESRRGFRNEWRAVFQAETERRVRVGAVTTGTGFHRCSLCVETSLAYPIGDLKVEH